MNVAVEKMNKDRAACVFTARTREVADRRRVSTAIFGRAGIFFAGLCSETNKIEQKSHKIQQNSRFLENTKVPPGNPTKKNPATEK